MAKRHRIGAVSSGKDSVPIHHEDGVGFYCPGLLPVSKKGSGDLARAIQDLFLLATKHGTKVNVTILGRPLSPKSSLRDIQQILLDSCRAVHEGRSTSK